MSEQLPGVTRTCAVWPPLLWPDGDRLTLAAQPIVGFETRSGPIAAGSRLDGRYPQSKVYRCRAVSDLHPHGQTRFFTGIAFGGGFVIAVSVERRFAVPGPLELEEAVGLGYQHHAVP
jgi:hypothetical protein